MSNLPWFRAYTEMVDDEKLRLLAFEDRWHFVAILCLKGQGVLDNNDKLMARKVAVKLGVDLRTLDDIARRLAEVGLIDEKTLQPVAWDNRQMLSDSSAARTRAYRERLKRHGDVTVTTQDTDTDKEVKDLSDRPAKNPTPKDDQASRFDDFWKTYPSNRKAGKAECKKRWASKRLDTIADQILSHVAAMRNTKQWKEGFEPAPLTYINQSRWDDGMPESARGGDDDNSAEDHFARAL